MQVDKHTCRGNVMIAKFKTSIKGRNKKKKRSAEKLVEYIHQTRIKTTRLFYGSSFEIERVNPHFL